eukprot:10444596-Prorocentrum_lima.AAC.1
MGYLPVLRRRSGFGTWRGIEWCSCLSKGRSGFCGRCSFPPPCGGGDWAFTGLGRGGICGLCR